MKEMIEAVSNMLDMFVDTAQKIYELSVLLMLLVITFATVGFVVMYMPTL
jgi:hypothetical protein